MLNRGFLLAYLALAVKAAVVNVNLFVGNKIIAPDGINRNTVLAGLSPTTLQFPGPLIKANKGDIINVAVNNRLTDSTQRRSTSVVFSGLTLPGHPEYLGHSFSHQCPIAPNHAFTYVLNTTDQAGTFLYRSGLNAQYSDGLRGPLIIYDPADPHLDLYDIDDETTIFQLGEWYAGHHPDVVLALTQAATIPIYQSGLINGVGRVIGGPDVPYPVFTVTSGKRYRLRLISNAPRAVMPFSVDGHTFTVIEADGISVVPVPNVQQVNIYPGQRYSVVFTANQTADNYWIRSFPQGGTQSRNTLLNANFSLAILRYSGAPAQNPTTPDTTRTVLTESQLVPLINAGPPGGANATPDLSLTLDFTTGPRPDLPFDSWRINNINYTEPSVPTLVSILNGSNTFPTTSHVVQVNPGALVELVMPLGEDGGGHPIHIEGVVFDVIQPGDTNVTNLVNPSRRDVIPIIGDTTIVRFRAPLGVAHLHCHIIWHAFVGLQMEFVSPPAQIRSAVHPSADWNQLCSIYNALPADQK